MRVGGPEAVCHHGAVVRQHGVEPPAVPSHYVRNCGPNSSHQPQLVGTGIEGPRRGHPAQLGAVDDPLLGHWDGTVQVQVHGQLLLRVVVGTYQMCDFVR